MESQLKKTHDQYFELKPNYHYKKACIPSISIIAPANLFENTSSTSGSDPNANSPNQRYRRRGFPITSASTLSIVCSDKNADISRIATPSSTKPFDLNLLQPEPAPISTANEQANLQSAWSHWTQRRRSSFLRRQNAALDNMSQVTARVPTPIIKAREESIKFVAAELKADHITVEDSERRARELRRQRAGVRSQIGKKGAKRRCHNHHQMEKLTINEWNKLIVYWEHPTFVKLRALSILSVFLSFIFGVVALSAPCWTNHEIGGHALYSGLWVNCFSHNDSCHSFFTQNIEGEYWQKAVIGLLIFSIAFAFIGSIFAVAGVCSQYIPKKMYYYHSSGEIFFVSAMTATVALAIYPYTVSNIMMYTKYNFGYGYGMAWTATVLLYVSAFTMMMDELIRESTRQRLQKLCNLRRKFDRYQTRQPSLPDNV